MSRLFQHRQAHAQALEPAPVRRGLIVGMLFVMAVLGFLSQTDRQIPPTIILICSLLGISMLAFFGTAQPDLPLYVMVAYLPFSKILVGDFGGIMVALNLTNILLVIVFINWMTGTSPVNYKTFQQHILHAPVLLMVGWVLLSFLRATFQYGSSWVPYYIGENLGELKRWLDPIIVYFLYFHIVRDRQRWKTIVAILMLGVFIAALMAIREYLTQSEGSSIESSRIGGIAGQPNILGAFFVYYMFLFAAFWLERIKQLKYWSFLVPFLACFRGIMVTFSRGAYLAFAQGVLGLTYFKHKLLFALAVLAVVFAVLNPWVLPEGIRYRMRTTFKPDTELVDPYNAGALEQQLDMSSAVRLTIWRGAMVMIQEHPWFGIGLGRFPYDIKNYLQQERWIDAHNAYIITAAEFGIPALIFLIVILLIVYRLTVIVYRHHPDPFIRTTALGFLGGLSGLFMANMFGSRLNTTEVSGYFWILAALMARAHLWVREGQKTGEIEAYGPAFALKASPRHIRRT